MLLNTVAFEGQDEERSEEWLVNRYQGLSLTGFTWSFCGSVFREDSAGP